MKFWLITSVLSIGWVAMGVGIFLWNEHAHNDAFDAAAGQFTGGGFVAIWGLALLFRFVKKQRDRSGPRVSPFHLL
jgi:hypothetical protein